jgi:hypothetical protein
MTYGYSCKNTHNYKTSTTIFTHLQNVIKIFYMTLKNNICIIYNEQ